MNDSNDSTIILKIAEKPSRQDDLIREFKKGLDEWTLELYSNHIEQEIQTQNHTKVGFWRRIFG